MKRPRWLPDTCPSTFPPPLFPFFSTWPPGNSHGYVSPRCDTTRHNGRSFKTREPIFAFVSRDSAPPLSHSTSQRSQRPTRQRGWQSGTERRRWDFFSPFPWRTNKTVRVVARVKRHEIRWPFFFTNHCSLLHEFIRYLSRYLTIYVRLCINYSFEKENGVTCYTLHIRVNKCKFFYA